MSTDWLITSTTSTPCTVKWQLHMDSRWFIYTFQIYSSILLADIATHRCQNHNCWLQLSQQAARIFCRHTDCQQTKMVGHSWINDWWVLPLWVLWCEPQLCRAFLTDVSWQWSSWPSCGLPCSALLAPCYSPSCPHCQTVSLSLAPDTFDQQSRVCYRFFLVFECIVIL